MYNYYKTIKFNNSFMNYIMEYVNITIVLIILFLFPLQGSCQKILQMEKKVSFKIWRYYPGDLLEFEINGQWFKRQIVDFDLENKYIIFHDGFVKLSDINRLRTQGLEVLGKGVATSLFVFGSSWSFFSLADWLVGGTLTLSNALVPASSFAIAGLLRLILKTKKHRLGKRKRLRLLDLTVYPTYQGA